MTHLVLHLLGTSPMDFFAMNGMWIFLAVCAIALFGIFLLTHLLSLRGTPAHPISVPTSIFPPCPGQGAPEQ